VDGGDPGENDYLMQLQTDKMKYPTKPSRIQVWLKLEPDQRAGKKQSSNKKAEAW
jgi:hypothetical protein